MDNELEAFSSVKADVAGLVRELGALLEAGLVEGSFEVLDRSATIDRQLQTLWQVSCVLLGLPRAAR